MTPEDFVNALEAKANLNLHSEVLFGENIQLLGSQTEWAAAIEATNISSS